MTRKRQKIQVDLAFMAEQRGEAPSAVNEGTERIATRDGAERPAEMERLMEVICQRENLKAALKRVQSNKGSPGVDGMTVGELGGYLKEHWPAIRGQLLSGTYVPQPVRRVEIPKPGGGVRKLGIPTVLDRFIQQAAMQVLQGQWDSTFSQHSYGFRPGRSAHQAVAQAQEYIAEGRRCVVDIDLEKFFDRVNHDLLMGRVAKRIADKRVLKLIRAYLNAGIMEGGLVSPSVEGTPQGGPLSPLLSNVLLDDLDRELECRGLHFVRYADDCNIYVRSVRAGQRVMESVTRWLSKRLKLQVNPAKSAVARAGERKFLGFAFTSETQPRRRIAPESLARLRQRVRAITRRTRGISLDSMAAELARYLSGWRGYFGFCQTPSVLEDLDSWIRRRLRCVAWKQWKRWHNRFAQLRKRDVARALAVQTAGRAHGPWRTANSPALQRALPNASFTALRLTPLTAP